MINVERIQALCLSNQRQIHCPMGEDLQQLGIASESNSDLLVYLRCCLPNQFFAEGQVYVSAWTDIVAWNLGTQPWTRVWKEGFLTFATTITGDHLLCDRASDRIYWAPSGRIFEECILLPDLTTVNKVTRDTIQSVIRPLAQTFDDFFDKLMTDGIERFIDQMETDI